MKKILFLLPIIALNFCFSQEKLTVSNIAPRLDTNGNIVDAHDGRVINFNGTYYWYGTRYGTTNGFTEANYYQCYSSKDLVNWKPEGRLLENQSKGVYYRPHVIFNKKTKKYVLWYNWYPKLWNGQFGVAISDKPNGPFKIVNDNVKMVNSSIGLGDFGLFVDDDETAYISYNTIQNHKVSVEKLDKKYTSSTMENGGTIAEHMEAGSMFKRGRLYYLLTDYTCCFCNQGSGARVYVSKSPLTGYAYTGNINREPGKKSHLLLGGTLRNEYEELVKSDSSFNYLHARFTKQQNISSVSITVFTGNRPANCGEVQNPKTHPDITIPSFKFWVRRFDKWKEITPTREELEEDALSVKVSYPFTGFEATEVKIIPYSTNKLDAVYVSSLQFKSDGLGAKKPEYSVFVAGPNIQQKPIIPAQQTYIMELLTKRGKEYIWMGDLWGSASDNVKGHDYQYWSTPLQFYPDGTIAPLEWVDSWQVSQ